MVYGLKGEKNHNMLLQAIVDQDMRFCNVMQNSSFRRLSKQVKWLDEKKKIEIQDGMELGRYIILGSGDFVKTAAIIDEYCN